MCNSMASFGVELLSVKHEVRPAVSMLRAACGLLLFGLSTLFHVVFLFGAALLKALLPGAALRRRLERVLMAIAESWIAVNSAMIRHLTPTRLTVQIDAVLRPSGHYLLIANHQSWVDIPVLQAVLNRRAPFARFFLKSQLFWVPVLGLAWWALNFPFMKRYSRETLARRPELAGRDLEATRRACLRFRDIPVTIVNFVEGTRFSPAKQAAQQSPYLHLLRPRAGGIAFVLSAMGDALHSVLDMTIVYPQGQRPSIIDLFGGRVAEIRVHLREVPIPAELAASDIEPTVAQERARAWINARWAEKDAQITRMLESSWRP